MKDSIPENETSIPFTVYGSSTSFLPLCGSERMRHEGFSQLAAQPPKCSQTSLLYVQGNPGRPTSQPSPSYVPLPLCHLFNIVAWTGVIGNLAEGKRERNQIFRKHKKLIHYFLLPFPWLPRNLSIPYVFSSPSGLPSALEQNDPDNYPQQYRWFPQRCGNDVLNMQSPKGDEDVHETSSL